MKHVKNTVDSIWQKHSVPSQEYSKGFNLLFLQMPLYPPERPSCRFRSRFEKNRPGKKMQILFRSTTPITGSAVNGFFNISRVRKSRVSGRGLIEKRKTENTRRGRELDRDLRQINLNIDAYWIWSKVRRDSFQHRKRVAIWIFSPG